MCLRRKWEGNEFSFSQELGNSKGSLRPFHSIVIHLCPIVHRVRGNSACVRRLSPQCLVAAVAFLLFYQWCISFKIGSQQVITQYQFCSIICRYKQTIVSLIRLVINSRGENVYTDSWCSSVYAYIVCRPQGSVIVRFNTVTPQCKSV